MSANVRLSHVAVLVPAVHPAATMLRELGYAIGPAEHWEGEGTLEIYVGERGKNGLLLLMEAVQDGAYQRALKKRGPGLHHIALDVANLEAYLLGQSGSGWLLHPRSVHTIKKTKTAYLARPGIPALIEVQERDSLSEETSLFTTVIELPVATASNELLQALGVTQIQPSPDHELWLTCEGKRFSVASLCHAGPTVASGSRAF